MQSVPYSKREMEKRVARFKSLKKTQYYYLDMVIPEYKRTGYSVLGPRLGEDPSHKPPIEAFDDGLNAGYQLCGPGKGPGLHSHHHVEVFVPLTGRWELYWGDEGENSLFLDKWDVVSVPAEVMRGIRNVSKKPALLIGFNPGGACNPRVTWSPKIIKRANELGWGLDDRGHLAKISGRGRAK